MMTQRWPGRLWIVRHGESAGNVARERRMSENWLIDIQARDVDVPPSPSG
jgi:broad specificity phosphatase PhoE